MILLQDHLFQNAPTILQSVLGHEVHNRTISASSVEVEVDAMARAWMHRCLESAGGLE